MERVPSRRSRLRLLVLSATFLVVFATGCGVWTDKAAGYLFGCNPGALDHPIVDDLETGIDRGDGTFDHSTFDVLVDEHVDETAGTVDYASLAEDEKRLDNYLGAIAEADLARLSRDAQLALLINAYNAHTLDLILDHYPDIDSIEEIEKPWSTEAHEVGGHTLSLDQIEHGLIRPLYRDPRIHFAVNCAAVDCPPLAESAYRGDAIDDQLAARTEATLSDEQFVRIEDGELKYTPLMDWYRPDFVDDSFEGSAESVAAYIRSHTRDPVREFIARHEGDPPASALSYDWSLNDAR